MKRLLVAVPTKERNEMIEEVLKHEMSYYTKYEIDICYFDSSTDNKTKAVIDAVNEEKGINILYQTENPEYCLDYKIVEMFKKFQQSEYEYYWLISDSISVSEDLLEYVMSVLENGYDLIRLPLSGAGEEEDYVTSDVNDWFHNCSQGMAHMASTIMSRSLLEIQTDWEQLRDRYVYNNTLDDAHGYFFTVGFYLEQIARLASFKGLLIGNRYRWRRDSPLKKEQVYWYQYVFETWAKSYPETILKLPDIYTDKESVIKKSDNITPGRFSEEMLIHYRLRGLYDIRVYTKYRSYFPYVTLENDECCRRIAETPIEILRQRYPNLLTVEGEWERKAEIIEGLVREKKVYLYGAGLYSEKVIRKMMQDGYGSCIKGIVVTRPEGNVKQLCDIKVYGIDEIWDDRDAYYVLCALPGTATEMKKELGRRGVSQYIGLFDV